MKRRISSETLRFLRTKPLTDKEKSFIMGAVQKQKIYFQLTPKIWAVVREIESRYKNE
tara:strand:- start:354 stop:527 length:174 start_codon:yes stop_codon:yes gene_type:complete